MAKSYLIDGSNPLGRMIGKALPADSKQILLNCAEDSGEEQEGRLYLRTGSGTALAARNIILEGIHKFDTIDEMVLIHPAEKEEPAGIGLLPTSRLMDETLDREGKPLLFLAREIIPYFQRQGSGRIVFIAQEPPEGAAKLGPDPINSAVREMLLTFFSQLAALYRDDPLQILPIRGATENPAELADYTLKQMDALKPPPPGKILHFSDKSSLLPFGRSR